MSAAPTSRTDRPTVFLAVTALVKWMLGQAKQRKSQLLDHDDLLYLVVTLKRVPAASRTNPTLIPLPHPLISAASSSLCIILDDRSPLTPAAVTSAFPSARVITLSDLRSDYRPFESRRKLCGSHDLFLADRRILPLLPRLLGKTFFAKKKLPLAVDFSRPGWPEQVRHCCESSLLYLRTGTCSGLKVGRLSQEVEEIVDNVVAVVDGAVDHVPKKWKNIRSLHLKSVDSLALPIYQAIPELGMKIDGSRKEEAAPVKFDDTVEGDDAEEMDEKSKRKKKVKKVKTVALPIYQAIPELGMKIDGSRKEEAAPVKFDDTVEEDDAEEMDEKSKRKKKVKKVKTVALPIYQAIPELGMKIDGSCEEEAAPVKFDDTVEGDDAEEMDEKSKRKKKLKKVKTGKIGKKEKSDGGVVRKVKKSKVK